MNWLRAGGVALLTYKCLSLINWLCLCSRPESKVKETETELFRFSVSNKSCQSMSWWIDSTIYWMKMEHRTTTRRVTWHVVLHTVPIHFRPWSNRSCERTHAWTPDKVSQTVTDRRAQSASCAHSFLSRVTEVAHVVSAYAWAPDKIVQSDSCER